MTTNNFLIKKEKLISILNAYSSLLVAFSGGVDSTFLLAVAFQAKGESVMAVTVDSPFVSRRELQEATETAGRIGIRHEVITLDILADEKIAANTKDRCYYCKQSLMSALWRLASERRLKTLAHGANLDDAEDYRPGLRAADEMGVVAPLVAAGLTKSEIRSLSMDMGLETWRKPALACMATRIPYGTLITREALQRVEAAEGFIQSLGFESCRVRHHGHVARIEVPSDQLERVLDLKNRIEIIRELRKIGYLHISLDLEGYGSGRMNRELGV